MDFIWVSVVPFILVAGAYASLGILPYVVPTAKIILNSPKTNPYALDFGSGPWFRYLIDYMLLSPIVMILAIGFIFYRLTQKDSDETVSYFLIIFVSLIFIYEFFTKNIRYVILLDYPIRIFALLMLSRICDRYSLRSSGILLTILVIAIAVFDYISFYTLFVKEAIYDPVSYWLLKVHQIIP